ncbi:hypothetical protein ACVIWU_005743 [Bradyrhizobium sp. USDA 4509]|nr:hypothetical protein [Bradyrhizobium elkanii]
MASYRQQNRYLVGAVALWWPLSSPPERLLIAKAEDCRSLAPSNRRCSVIADDNAIEEGEIDADRARLYI